MNIVKAGLTPLGIVLFTALLLVGGGLGIRSALSFASTREEGKLIAHQTIVEASNIGKGAEVDSKELFRYTVLPDLPSSGEQPGAKDISGEKAAAYAAVQIKQMFGDNLEGGHANVQFSKSSSAVILKDMWIVFFNSADGGKSYVSHIDSVTGEVYYLTLFDKNKDPLNFGVEPENMTPEQVQAWQAAVERQTLQQDALRNDKERFIAVARDIVNTWLLKGRTVVSASFNSLGGVNSRLVAGVAVYMSDGSGYLIQLDGFTGELVSFNTFPDSSGLTDNFRRAPSGP